MLDSSWRSPATVLSEGSPMPTNLLDPAQISAPPDLGGHRQLRDDDFWTAIPGFDGVHADEFHDHHFQVKNSVTHPDQLKQLLGSRVDDAFMKDLELGLKKAPMALRISPYILSLIDWTDPFCDPLAKQFLPLASRQIADHPQVRLDSLGERSDAPVEGLIHRYPDKALFLALDSCPVYCRFCTRSYAVGRDTEEIQKMKLLASLKRWQEMFDYIGNARELEDIVISGGDTYNLKPEHIVLIGETLLKIPHIRRIRFATKGLCVMPQKILTDSAWFESIARVVKFGRKLHKDVVVHTHFNHPNEITEITRKAMNRFAEEGIMVRCQTVLQNGVNDRVDVMKLLVSRLSYVNIHPYYVYFHDMVPGVEDLRTSLATGLHLEKHVRGSTAGFNTPSFVVDTMGGGGKRDAHSYEYYDQSTGIAVFTSPSVRPGKYFLYFDPISGLDPIVQERWKNPAERKLMVGEALEQASMH